MHDFPLFFIAFIVLISILIVVHELGHYALARLCGVKVLRFSLGFGPILWSRRFGKDATQWTLCALPLGGFVSMLGEQDDEGVSATEQHRAFCQQHVGKRAAIVAAGPLANFGLAILVYWVMFSLGGVERMPVLGAPPFHTPAAQAGLANGDTVEKVGGLPVKTWSDFRWAVLQQAADTAGARLELELRDSQGGTRTARLDTAVLAAEGWQGDPFRLLGLRVYLPQAPASIDRILPDSPAQASGLLAGDTIIAIDGQPVRYWYEAHDIIMRSPERPLRVLVTRRTAEQETEVALNLTPRMEQEDGLKIGRAGMGWVDRSKLETPELWRTVRYGPLDAAGRALGQTWATTSLNLKFIVKMVTGEVSVRNLSGPVTIAEYAGKTAKLGLEAFLSFMALVSIGLGVVNLFPIPVLDGGHLLYYCVEFIKGRAVSERVMLQGQRVGILFLIAVMAFALFNDLSRHF
jgi:regulator of sigma E protease